MLPVLLGAANRTNGVAEGVSATLAEHEDIVSLIFPISPIRVLPFLVCGGRTNGVAEGVSATFEEHEDSVYSVAWSAADA